MTLFRGLLCDSTANTKKHHNRHRFSTATNTRQQTTLDLYDTPNYQALNLILFHNVWLHSCGSPRYLTRPSTLRFTADRPVQTNLVAVSETQFVFSLPSPRTINHLVVFLLPDTILPPTHGATVHIRFPNSPTFKLLGAIAINKPSAIFKVRPTDDIPEEGEVTLGISVEEAAAVEAQLATLGGGAAAQSGALVRAGQQVTTLIMARRIIANAFTFLGSFAQGANGEEMVPLRAFREWWVKFEKKVEYDPSFLERAEE